MQYELQATINPVIPLMASLNIAPTTPQQGEESAIGGTAIATVHAYTTTPTITGIEKEV